MAYVGCPRATTGVRPIHNTRNSILVPQEVQRLVIAVDYYGRFIVDCVVGDPFHGTGECRVADPASIGGWVVTVRITVRKVWRVHPVNTREHEGKLAYVFG